MFLSGAGHNVTNAEKILPIQPSVTFSAVMKYICCD
jgi:hypothetical protein